MARTLQTRHPELAIDLVKITTRGDKSLGVLIPEIGGKGFFTEELDQGLLRGEIDLAVHSLKDLPTQLPEGLMLGAVCNRKWVHDVLIGRESWTLDGLPYNANVGTCSMRRAAQIKYHRPDLNILPLRGNVPTRIQKLRAGEYDAIVLAEAGVRRLGLDAEIAQVLPVEVILPAPAQGALGIEILADNHAVRHLVAALDEPATRAATACERAVLHELEAGCQVPVAALADIEGKKLSCRALIASLDGARVLRDSIYGGAAEAERLGKILAQRLLQQGGEEILANIKSTTIDV